MGLVTAVLLISLAVAVTPEDVSSEDLLSEVVAPVKFTMPNPQADLSNITLPGMSRIINGYEAPRNNFPYQVGMEIRVAKGYTWCGGALISQDYVLTAAHCIYTAVSVTLYFGAHDRTNFYETTQKRVYVDKLYFKVHEEWNPSTLRNDIALIRIPSKIEYSRYIEPVAIPTRALVGNMLSGSPAIATGWGYTTGSAQLARYLQFADVIIQDQNVCISYLKPWVQPTNICIDGSDGLEACYGDSGSPLVTTNGMKFVIGVASFIGYYGCEAKWPSVYTRVSAYLDWISLHSGVPIN